MALSKKEREERDALFNQGLKRCAGCGEIKPLDVFDKDKRSMYGVQCYCKICRAQYRQEHREETSAWKKQYRQTAHGKETVQRYWRTHKDKKAEKDARYFRGHKEEKYEYDKQYRLENKERLDALKQQYNQTPKGKAIRRAIGIRYLQTPNGKASQCAGRFRRRVRIGDNLVTSELKIEVIDASNGICPYCGNPINGDGHIDHIIPVSRGGTNGLGNLVYCCAHCNLSKNNKDLNQWLSEMGYEVNFHGALA